MNNSKGTLKILRDFHLIIILEVADWLESITYANGIFYSLEIDKSLMQEKPEIWWQFTASVFYRLPDSVYLTWKLEVLRAWSLEEKKTVEVAWFVYYKLWSHSSSFFPLKWTQKDPHGFPGRGHWLKLLIGNN